MSSAPMKPGDVIAYRCIAVRVPKRGEAILLEDGQIAIAWGNGQMSFPILERIEGASVCEKVERAHLDAHKKWATDTSIGSAPLLATGSALEAHYRAVHAREQAAKRAKWIARRMASGRWVVEQESQVLWDSEWPGCSESAAQARAATLNALEAKP